MGLYERWTATDDTKLKIHPFATALREAARGGITRQQLIDLFDLEGDDVIELDAIIAHYTSINVNNNAALTQAEKDRFIVLLGDVMILSNDNQTRPLYTRQFALSRLGF